MRGVIQVEPTSTIATALKVNKIRLNARNEIPDMSVKIALSNHQSRAAKLSDNSTSGVALILVLGALSLMLILAVSFAVSVRTERLAAGNYADSVRARHLAQVGLVRAMNDINDNLSDPDGQPHYPGWSVTNSSYSTETNSTETSRIYTTPLLNLATNDSIPRALTNAVKSAIDYNPASHWVEIWSEVPNKNAPSGIENNLIGRVGYLILNCSGLLDANFVGGADRASGRHPNEIAIEQLLGELPNGFTNERAEHVRYENLVELAKLNNCAPTTNFCVYSYCPPGYWDPANKACRMPINLAGDLTKSERHEAITSAFFNALNFSPEEAKELYTRLIDYANADTMPVPMINEIVFTNKVTQEEKNGSTDWSVEFKVAFELWYPFLGHDAGSYTFDALVNFESAADIVPVEVSLSFDTQGSPTSQPFKVIYGDKKVTYNKDPEKFTVKLEKAQVTRKNESTMNSLSPYEWQMDVDAALCLECLDPRFNEDLSNSENSEFWRKTDKHSLNEVNPWVKEYQTSTNHLFNHPDPDQGIEMYSAHAPLQSAAELGYLAYAPWRTIKLYGPDLHRVLDVFKVDTNMPDSIYATSTNCGLVNFNTNVAVDALAACFVEMPLDQYQYPGDPDATRLDMDKAHLIASRIMDNPVTKGFYTNLADLGRGLTDSDFEQFGADNELKKEAFFRNTIGLFNLRQSLFMIIIEAQAASAGHIPRNAARQRAVALVWRDPYTGEFIKRSFQWLND